MTNSSIFHRLLRIKTSTVFILFLFLMPNSVLRKSNLVNPQNYEARKMEQTTNDFAQSIKQETENVYKNKPTSSDVLTEAEITKSGDYLDGHNLFVLGKYPKKSYLEFENILYITDMDGNIFRQREYPSYAPFTALSAEFINSTTVMYGLTRTTTALWNIYTNDTQVLPIGGHHEIEYNPINNTFFTFGKNTTIIDDVSYLFDLIMEYDINGTLIWELDTQDFINQTQECPYHDMNQDDVDLTHSNSIFFDAEEDVIYYNARNVNTFYKINHTNGEIIWGVGEYGDFALFNKREVQKDILFYHAHAVEKIDENRFILFDNDLHNQTFQDNFKSRILEITIDENSMTANVSWSFEPPTEYYTAYWGDADYLANGNRLGTFGTRTHPNTDINARLVEVNPKGEIVWEMNFPDSEYYFYGLYRAERVALNPILSDPLVTRALTGSNISLNWETQYNFRSKYYMQGSFEVYLNSSSFDSDVYYFDKFWRKKDLIVDFGFLSKGSYNITLVLYDESGISTRSNFIFQVADYFIYRQGLTNYEKGHINFMINWTGESLTELDYNLTADSSLVDEGKWTNHTIEFDLDSLSVGEHFINFQLFNNSLLLYIDNFIVTIYPFEAPEIIVFPSNQDISWSFSTLLEWEIFDNSPLFWEIYINDTIYFSETWNTKNLSIVRDFSFLDESLYNVTLIAIEGAFQKNMQTSWIRIVPPNPPIISSFPEKTLFSWGDINAYLEWIVHGGTEWTIWKNGSLYSSNEKTENMILFFIDGWDSGEFLPGVYNLTLVVSDDLGAMVKDTIFIQIYLNLGDPYANDIIVSQTFYCSNPVAAIGAPNGIFAVIYLDYSNGYITLDMGESEEIIDGIGDDFWVIGCNGEYFVWVSDNSLQPFSLLGSGKGNQSFDLSTTSLDKSRYVRIEFQGGDFVEIDAIVALNYNLPERDTDKPEITNLKDFWVWEDQTSFVLNWEAFDKTPWNYSISVDGILSETGAWYGGNILFNYTISNVGTFSFKLVLFDLFGNSDDDIVRLIVKPFEGILKQNLILAIVIPIISIIAINVSVYTFVQRRKMK